MVTVEKRRTEEVRVKLAPAMASEFGEIAKARGLLPATLAAVALGEYVEKYRQNAQLQRMVALDASKRMAGLISDGEALGKAIAQAMSNPELTALFSDAEGRADGCTCVITQYERQESRSCPVHGVVHAQGPEAEKPA